MKNSEVKMWTDGSVNLVNGTIAEHFRNLRDETDFGCRIYGRI